MNYVFLGLAVLNTIFLLGALVLGYGSAYVLVPQSLHIVTGLFAAFLTCLVHSIVFVYFLGTGKSIKTACEEYALEPAFIKETKHMKARAFPFALLGTVAMIAAAISGGALASAGKSASSLTHHVLILFAFIFNLVCFFLEYKVIVSNMSLIGRMAGKLPD